VGPGKFFEALGVEPMFPEKRQAIDYAETRARSRSGEIRVLECARASSNEPLGSRAESEAVIAQATKL